MKIEITLEEILEDLCHPGLPPGRWNVPARSPRSERRDDYPLTSGEPEPRAASRTAAVG